MFTGNVGFPALIDENARIAAHFEYPRPSWFRRVFRVFAVSGPVVHGVDVSKWQGLIDFVALKAGGYDFAIIKASDGLTADPYFSTNWRKAIDAGIIPGCYHFFRDNYLGADQANFHLNTIQPLRDATNVIIPSHADVEIDGGVSIEVRINRLFAWLIYIETAWKKPGVYSSNYYWNKLTNNAALSTYYGWVAHWTSGEFIAPVNWNKSLIKMHQYGVALKHGWVPALNPGGTVPGVSGACDCDYFLGTKDDLLAWSGYVPTPPPPDDIQKQIDALMVRVGTLEDGYERMDREVILLQTDVADLEDRVAGLEARVTALEEGEPEPPEPPAPPPNTVTVVVTDELKTVARYIWKHNDADPPKPIMAIWYDQGGKAVKWLTGETLEIYNEGAMTADGGTKWYMVVPGGRVPSYAPDLYVNKEEVMKVE